MIDLTSAAIILLGLVVFLVLYLKLKKTGLDQKALLDQTSQETRTLHDNLNTKENELSDRENQLLLLQKNIEEEKIKIDEKNKKIWKMSEAALREKQRLEELNITLNADKEKLETEKKKLDEKIKKLWQTSITIHKEKERISELNEMLETEKQKTETLLAEISLKNTEITDNIYYARQIQSAILPNIKLIQKKFPDSFVLYEPKDIVSGDFYAFFEKDNRHIIMAGDCTGHGVSGALMSMIGSSLLNEIINGKGITEPASILNQLNISVIESLNQGENESRDGMDIAICSFDQAKNELQYAGANRPVWIVRDGEINVYKPDKFPIGGLQIARENSYTNYRVPLKGNDTVYMFTDGYADQFGGENGKKLMTAKFKEVLLTIQPMTMQEQLTHLRSYIDAWKGDHEQVDDILVIGVRV